METNKKLFIDFLSWSCTNILYGTANFCSHVTKDFHIYEVRLTLLLYKTNTMYIYSTSFKRAPRSLQGNRNRHSGYHRADLKATRAVPRGPSIAGIGGHASCYPHRQSLEPQGKTDFFTFSLCAELLLWELIFSVWYVCIFITEFLFVFLD